MCGHETKDSGEVFIDGMNLDKDLDRVKSEIGVVFQFSVLDKVLTVKDNLQSRASLYGLSKEQFECRLNELDELLGYIRKKLNLRKDWLRQLLLSRAKKHYKGANMEYILVTGANGGMGKATTLALKNRGYGVIALDREEVTIDGIHSFAVDLTREEEVVKTCEKIKGITDKLYGIIHFAGIYMLDSLVEMSTEDFDKIFKVNVYSAYMVNKTFLPMLKMGSRIIMTTSELAPLNPLPFTGIYAVTKSALDKYAHSLRMELQLLGISVSVLRAGAVSTGMLNVSTTALDKFCENTKLYKCNADRFKKIVNGVEAKNISPEKLASKVLSILEADSPKMVYSINRNIWLRLLNILPTKWQFAIIKKILK